MLEKFPPPLDILSKYLIEYFTFRDDLDIEQTCEIGNFFTSSVSFDV